MAVDKNSVEQSVIDTGVDFVNRRIYWGILKDGDSTEEFCWANVEHMVRAMHQLQSLSNKPIELHFNCGGGEVYAMIRLMDEIEASTCQIKFIGSGLIASATSWVLAVCDHRVLHKNTVVMLHDGSEGFMGSVTDSQIAAIHSKKLQDRLHDVFAKNTRMPKEFYTELLQRDLYLNPEECVLIGLCDEIIEPKKRGQLRRARIAKLAVHPEAADLQKLTKDLYSRIGRRKPSKLEIAVKQEEFEPEVDTATLQKPE
jgi:ATP-dependent protease ClpP protease subunit